MHLDRCFNIEDLRLAAKSRLPRALFEYIDGVAEDGVSYRANRRAFDSYQLLPGALVNVEHLDTSIELFGETLPSPLLLCPTAFTRAFHHQGESAVARAAKTADLVYTLSTVANTSMEDIAAIGGRRWFQIYVYKDRGLLREFISRARESGYSALCLTVDASTPGNREHDIRNGLVIPPRPGLKTIIDAAMHPHWCWHMLTSPAMTTANISGSSRLDASKPDALLKYMAEQLAINLDWDDVSWMMEEWQGPFMIKGILHTEDAIRAAELGVDAIVVSNHGGRQLDHAAATLDVLPEIVAAVGEKCEIILDSGIRRGNDITKALALGAKACMVGRPYLYGLAAGGEAGVEKAIGFLLEEFQRSLRLLGCTSLAQLGPDYLRKP